MNAGLMLRLVDVVLLLLFGFISLASIRQDAIEPAESKEIDALLYRPSPATVEFRGDGSIYYNGQQVNPAELPGLIEQRRLVVLLADRDASGRRVLETGRMLARQGFEVSIMLHYRPSKSL